jgi:hypothetical protein
MDESSSPRPDADDDEAGDETLVVAVTRSGGFAGLTRVWKAAPREDEASRWRDLISRCPWDERPAEDARGADRFRWSIHATCRPDEDRTADLPDRALIGPWRELVDAVREWSDERRDRAD